jgi:cytochrome c peroxidase
VRAVLALGMATGLAIASCTGSNPSALPKDAGNADAGATDASDGYAWVLPKDFPVPNVPQDNPMSEAKVALGRRLFYDKRLSGNQTYACASCHDQARSFTDGRAQALGSTGDLHPRSSMSLANVGYASTLGWASPVLKQLEQQALVPMFGETPVELGLAGKDEEVLLRLKALPLYQDLFAKAFPAAAAEPDLVSLAHVTQALASFERTMISGGAPIDRFLAGDRQALSAEAKRGKDLFFTERFECFHCHGGFTFADSVTHAGKTIREELFHNNALYNIDGKGAYPADNIGLKEFTGQAADMGRMRAPSLRNIEVTAPYMHDGSIATLDEVIEHYAAGGRTLRAGPNAGIGAKNPYKSEFVKGFEATAEEKADLLAFLRSLTDRNFLSDPRLSDPW